MPGKDDHPVVQKAGVVPSKRGFQRPNCHNLTYPYRIKPSLEKGNETLLSKLLVGVLPAEMDGKDTEIEKLDKI